MSCLLDRLLEPGALAAHFQPVFHLHGCAAQVDYFEGLLRTTVECVLPSPDVLFSYARRKRAEAALDRAAVRTVLRAARELPKDTSVGLNVHASTLAADPEFVSFLCDSAQQCWIHAERIVIEVVEQGQPCSLGALHDALRGLRDVGARIALDDLGKGQANLQMLLACSPSIVKLDRYFVHGAELDPGRRAVQASVAGLARSLGARVVAEGVETREEFDAVRASGIDGVQGYLFARPAPPEDFRSGVAPALWACS